MTGTEASLSEGSLVCTARGWLHVGFPWLQAARLSSHCAPSSWLSVCCLLFSLAPTGHRPKIEKERKLFPQSWSREKLPLQ